MIKKLIGFSETLLENVEKYATENEKTFSDAVRSLIQMGLNNSNTDNVTEDSETPSRLDNTSNQVEELTRKVDKLTDDSGWFKADDTQSRLGNAELNIKTLSEMVEEMGKKLNVVVASSKFFKKHIDNRSIHLQD